MITTLLLTGFIILKNVDGSVIVLNPGSVVAMWAPRVHDHVAHGTHCIIRTDDGHFITTSDKCERVRDMIESGD